MAPFETFAPKDADEEARTALGFRPRSFASDLIALEPRMVFDGAAAATAVEVKHSADATPDPAQPDATADDNVSDGESLAAALAPAASQAPAAREIVFVDARVADAQAFANASGDRLVVMVGENEDGIATIDRVLSDQAGEVSALHIIGHGVQGSQRLGSTWMSAGSIESNTEILRGWQSRLTAEADILLYGCDVASGEPGAQFISALANASQADVAASTDAVGATEAGADWTLERATGSVEALAIAPGGYGAKLSMSADIVAESYRDEVELNGVAVTSRLQRGETSQGLNVSNDRTPTFSGPAVAGAVVRLYDVTGGARVLLGTATANAQGRFALLSGADGAGAPLLQAGERRLLLTQQEPGKAESDGSTNPNSFFYFNTDDTPPEQLTGAPMVVADRRGSVFGETLTYVEGMTVDDPNVTLTFTLTDSQFASIGSGVNRSCNLAAYREDGTLLSSRWYQNANERRPFLAGFFSDYSTSTAAVDVTRTFYVHLVDRWGNVSGGVDAANRPLANGVRITLRLVMPQAATITGLVDNVDQTGAVVQPGQEVTVAPNESNPPLVNDPRPVLKGSGWIPGSTLKLTGRYTNYSGVVTDTSSALAAAPITYNPDGAWSIELPLTGLDGRHTITVYQLDAGGSASINQSMTFNLDGNQPDFGFYDTTGPVRTIEQTAGGGFSGELTDEAFTDGVTLVGKAQKPAGSVITVNYTITSPDTGATKTGTGTTTVGSDKRWSFTIPSGDLGFGRKTITATATDQEGQTYTSAQPLRDVFVTGAWSPGGIGIAGISTWFDASSLSNMVVSNGRVATLFDLSGNFRNASQTNAAKQPTLLTLGPNLHALSFDKAITATGAIDSANSDALVMQSAGALASVIYGGEVHPANNDYGAIVSSLNQLLTSGGSRYGFYVTGGSSPVSYGFIIRPPSNNGFGIENNIAANPNLGFDPNKLWIVGVTTFTPIVPAPSDPNAAKTTQSGSVNGSQISATTNRDLSADATYTIIGENFFGKIGLVVTYDGTRSLTPAEQQILANAVSERFGSALAPGVVDRFALNAAAYGAATASEFSNNIGGILQLSGSTPRTTSANGGLILSDTSFLADGASIMFGDNNGAGVFAQSTISTGDNPLVTRFERQWAIDVTGGAAGGKIDITFDVASLAAVDPNLDISDLRAAFEGRSNLKLAWRATQDDSWSFINYSNVAADLVTAGTISFKNVTVGAGAGMLRDGFITLMDGPSITDIGNPDAAQSIIKVPETTFKVTISEQVTNLVPASFNVNLLEGSFTSTGVKSVSAGTPEIGSDGQPTGRWTYDVVVRVGEGEGRIALNYNYAAPTAADLPAPGAPASSGGNYMIKAAYNESNVNIKFDTKPPIPTLTISDPVIKLAGGTGPAAEPATVTIAFDEAATGFGIDDLSVSAGTLSNFRPSGTDGKTYLVDYLAPAGLDRRDVTFTVRSGPGSYVDDIGNEANRDFTLSYALDTVRPKIASITRANPVAEATNADALTFRVAFTEDLRDGTVDATDFVVSGTTATVSQVTRIDARTYEVLVSGGNLESLDGTVGLAVAASSNIEDLAFAAGAASDVGNRIDPTAPATNESYTLDNTGPGLTFDSYTDDALPSVGNFGSGTTTDDAIPVFNGKVSNLTDVALTSNGAPFPGTIVYGASDSAGVGLRSWTFTPSGALANGTYNLRATAYDPVGNVSRKDFVVTVSSTLGAANDAASLDEQATVTKTAAEGVLSNDAGVLSVSRVKSSTGSFVSVTSSGVSVTTDYGVLTISSDGAYAYVANGAASRALGAGVTATDVFTYEAPGSSGSIANATLTFTITGLNDAPTIGGTSAGSVTEKGGVANATAGVAAAAGSLTIADPDTGESKFRAPSSLAGTYGSFTFNNATGAWTYTLDDAKAATESLTAGQQVSDKLAVTSFDGSKTHEIIITVTGANDNASIAVDGAVTDDRAVTEAGGVANGAAGDPNASGKLTVSDVDTGQAAFQTPASLAGTYGTFTFAAATGAWTYVLDNSRAATQALTAGQSVSDTLAVKSSDGTATHSIVVAITGSNDNATIAVDGAVSDDRAVTEAGGVSNGTPGDPNASGRLRVTDVDAGQAAFQAPSSLAGTYGTFTFNASTGAWTYVLDNSRAATQALTAGQSVTDRLVVASLDGTATHNIDIAVTGANDSASIAVDGSVTDDRAVTEAGGVSNGTAGDPSASGKLLVSDVDAGQAVFQALSSLAGTYGTFTFNASTGAWTYALDNSRAATQALTAGQSVNDTLAVKSSDGTATHNITVNITGANDNASISVDGTVPNDRAVTEAGGVSNGTPGDPNASGKLLVSDVDTGQAVFQTPSSLAGTYGTFTFNASTGAWTYALDNSRAATQALTAGQTVTDRLVVASLDGTATSNIDITVTGANDDATIAIDGSVTNDRSVKEAGGVSNSIPGDPSASGKLLVSDIDAGEQRYQSPASLIGTYGTFTFDAQTGAWTYTLDDDRAATQALTTGQTVTDRLVVTSLDGKATHNIDISVVGVKDDTSILVDGSVTNDRAVVEAGGAANAIPGDPSASGRLMVIAGDSGQGTFQTPSSLSGTYGTFTFNATTGAWTYALDNSRATTQALKAGQAATDKLTVKSADGLATHDIVIAITGANDDASVSIDGTVTDDRAVTEAGGASNANPGDPSASGKLKVSDVDAGEAVFKIPASLAGVYGDFTFNAATGAWTYRLDNSRTATQALTAGQSASDTLAVSSLDGASTHSIVVAVTGAADDATIAIDGATPNDRAVTEAGGVSNGTAGDPSASGKLLVTDPDSGQAAFRTPSSLAGTYGTFTFDAARGAWTYALDDSRAATEALSAGQSVTDTLSVTSLDGAATHNIVVAIAGANDAPVVDASASVVSAALVETDAALSASGRVVATDVDSAVLTASRGAQNVTVSGLALSAAQEAAIRNGFSVQTNGAWTYALPSPDYLPAGAAVTLTTSVDVSDGAGGTVSQLVTITITGSNDTPVVPATSDIVVDEDGAATALVGAVDAEGSALAYSLKPGAGPLHGAVTFDAASGAYTYRPDANCNGTDSFVILVSDGVAAPVEQVVSIVVRPVNDPPIGDVSISGLLQVGQTLTANPALSDIDGMGPVQFQWMLDGADIPGANAQTYVIQGVDAGRRISVRAFYVDGGGTLESVSSQAVRIAEQVVPQPEQPPQQDTQAVDRAPYASVGHLKVMDVIRPDETRPLAPTIRPLDPEVILGGKRMASTEYRLSSRADIALSDGRYSSLVLVTIDRGTMIEVRVWAADRQSNGAFHRLAGDQYNVVNETETVDKIEGSIFLVRKGASATVDLEIDQGNGRKARVGAEIDLNSGKVEFRQKGVFNEEGEDSIANRKRFSSLVEKEANADLASLMAALSLAPVLEMVRY